MKIKISKLFICFAIISIVNAVCFSQNHTKISEEDRQYLSEIAKQTWSYLDRHLAEKTGFPTDTQKTGGTTNTTNIGLYLASIGPACEMGFISRNDALERIRKIIASVQRIESRRGFIYNWLDVDGDTKMSGGVLAVSDFNKLITGLILTRQYFPELNKQCSMLVDRMDWSIIYNPANHQTCWGYDAKNDVPVGWGNSWLASDCRSIAFYMIATETAPPQLWDTLKREKVKTAGLEFYEPGYWFGGLFMSAMDAMFLNERGTEMGSAIGDMAWHQIRMAKQLKLDVWGWSNCDIPCSGYTEGGFLPQWVVTPHASILAIEYYPKHVIANLKKLDKMGLRKPLTKEAPVYGFRDSVDLRNGKLDDRYLSLDQAMIFISLANFLEDGTVRKHFAADSLVKKGMQLLGKRMAANQKQLARFARRDAGQPQPLFTTPATTGNVIFDFTKPTKITLSKNVYGDGTVQTNMAKEGLVIDFDLGKDGKGELDVVLHFPPTDMRNLKDIKIKCAATSQGELGSIRLCLFDNQNQQQYMNLCGVTDKMQELTLEQSKRFGIFARPQQVNRLRIKLWGSPWFYTNQKTTGKSGKIIIEKIIFERK
ncbi:MAG: DUF3131 domain-containing protein [Planctomycetes bacterium]|nr:DUF3131 domain-containing protein [Planctomycetota bacterium]